MDYSHFNVPNYEQVPYPKCQTTMDPSPSAQGPSTQQSHGYNGYSGPSASSTNYQQGYPPMMQQEHSMDIRVPQDHLGFQPMPQHQNNVPYIHQEGHQHQNNMNQEQNPEMNQWHHKPSWPVDNYGIYNQPTANNYYWNEQYQSSSSQNFYQELDARITPPMDHNDHQNFQHAQTSHKTPAVAASAPKTSVMFTPESEGDISLRKDVSLPHQFDNPASVFPTFGVPQTEEGQTVVDQVDGRLPIVGDRSKYDLEVDELRRRTGAPEFMNCSSLYGFFRKTKKREGINEVRENLVKSGIAVKSMQRQRTLNTFSGLLEKEAVQFAFEIETMYKKWFPLAEMSRTMLDLFIEEGLKTEEILVILNDTAMMMERIILTLSTRQPKITGQEERLKGNDLDLPYHIFSLSTHGFGHPISLTHYKLYLDVIKKAADMCYKLLEGAQLSPIKIWDGIKKPFEGMTNEAYLNEVMRSLGAKDPDDTEETLEESEAQLEANEPVPETSQQYTETTYPYPEWNNQFYPDMNYYPGTTNTNYQYH